MVLAAVAKSYYCFGSGHLLSKCIFVQMYADIDPLCDLVVRVPGYRKEIIVFPVRYELNLYMLCT
jgi:hypothetical protein